MKLTDAKDMIPAGIVDPTKVTRSVLQNAASVASTLLTTESIVTDIPTPPAPVAPAGDMGGMYWYNSNYYKAVGVLPTACLLFNFFANSIEFCIFRIIGFQKIFRNKPPCHITSTNLWNNVANCK